MDTNDKKEEYRKLATRLIAIHAKELNKFSQPPWKYLPEAKDMRKLIIAYLPELERMERTGNPDCVDL